jgi:hypothetical protein
MKKKDESSEALLKEILMSEGDIITIDGALKNAKKKYGK